LVWKNTIDDTTESSLLPFLEVLELETQIKLSIFEKFITTKQDQKRPAVYKKPPPPEENKRCKGHKDACGNQVIHGVNASIIQRTFTSVQNTGIKSPTKLRRLPRKNEQAT
jgi:hypothetical protein